MMRFPCFQMTPFSVPWASSVDMCPSLHSIRSIPYFRWYRMQSTSWSMLVPLFLTAKFSWTFIQTSQASFRQTAVSKRVSSERDVEFEEILLRIVDMGAFFVFVLNI